MEKMGIQADEPEESKPLQEYVNDQLKQTTLDYSTKVAKKQPAATVITNMVDKDEGEVAGSEDTAAPKTLETSSV